MIGLSHPYPAVDWGEVSSYGGSQTRSAKWQIRRCGCGAVAMTDLVLYLTRWHGCAGLEPVAEAAAQDPIPAEAYDRCCCSLQQRYLPMVPPFGINGLSLTGGLALYARLHKLPFRIRWHTGKRELFACMEQMLRQDLPVILAIAPNLPAVWQQHKVQLYRRSGDTYTAVTAVKGHYVTVTGMDDRWLQVSSWGKEYYILRQDYWEYGERYSTFAIHNFLLLEPKN